MTKIKAYRPAILDFDFISARDNTEAIPVCLTLLERQILMAVIEPVAWLTRWTGNVDSDVIESWRDGLYYKLMGECAMDCNEVWACLGISPVPDDLLTWLQNQMASDPEIIETIQNPPGTIESPIATEIMVSECDKDVVFAFALQLVQFINTAITDVFELIEAATNAAEFAAVVLEKIPGAAQVTGFMDYLQEAIAEQYLASYDTTLEHNYACAIMCMIVSQEDCEATWDDLYQYFLQRFGAGLANKDIIDLLEFIGGGLWTGTEFCDAMFAAFCGMMFYGDSWANITLAGIQRFWASWLNDSNPDWETLCGESCGWSLDQLLGSTYSETWWEATCGIEELTIVRSTICGGFRGLIINIIYPEPAKTNRIKIYYRYDGLGADGEGRYTVFDNEDEILKQGTWVLNTMSGDVWDTFIKYIDQEGVSRVKFELIASFDEEEGGYTATNEITLDGSGDDPFA